MSAAASVHQELFCRRWSKGVATVTEARSVTALRTLTPMTESSVSLAGSGTVVDTSR